MNDRRDAVAVTGLGVVTPLGVGRQRFWTALCAGESAIRPFGDAAAPFPHVAARIAEPSSGEIATSPQLRRADRLSRTIVTAARLALADAHLVAGDAASERVAVVVGSALGNISDSARYLERLFTKGPALASPMMFPNLVLNAPAGYAAMEIGCTGANLTVSHGEVSSEHAMATGYDLIQSGRADVVLAGGGDELAEILIAGYRRFGVLSGQRGGPEWSSPYDVQRNGVVLGEGAGMLVLEPAERARQRGATVYALMEDYFSFGVPAPIYDWPRRVGTAPARLQAFLARVSSPEIPIDLVCGAANSSRRLDAWEVEVLARVFGESAAGVTLTSIKGAVGEFGAAGVLSAAATCMALHSGLVPPLASLREPPAEVPFQFVAGIAVPRPLRRALMFSTARGGASIALLFAHPTA